MKNILDPKYRSILQIFEKGGSALVFDFDGTLAPIVENPQEAFMRPSTVRLVRQISELYPCAILSGRARQDIVNRMVGISVKCVVGNHGIEWDPPDPDLEKYRGQVRSWLPVLTGLLQPLWGVEIEDKGFSLSIHYRKSSEKDEVFLAIGEALSQIGSVHIMGGKEVFNCLPQGAPKKGDALAKIRTFLKCCGAIYLGDDVTDEDAFAKKDPFTLLGIRVGRNPESHSEFYLENQEEIDGFLKVMLTFRA